MTFKEILKDTIVLFVAMTLMSFVISGIGAQVPTLSQLINVPNVLSIGGFIGLFVSLFVANWLKPKLHGILKF